MKKLAGIFAVAGLLVGVFVGYLMWGQATRRTGDEFAAIRGSLSAEKLRSDELQSKLADVESRIKVLTVELNNERTLRHKYEEFVNKGRK